jgi:dihydrofolate reductase
VDPPGSWDGSRARPDQAAGTRRIINSTYLTLDGVVEEPHLWPSVGSDDTGMGEAIQTELLMACDAVLMGRHTYDGFAPVWPTRSGDPYSERINAIRKYVVSSTLADPQWNNTTIIDGDVVGAISELKRMPGMDIVQYGFGDVTALLLNHGLLDEIRLWLHPLFLGTARPGDLLFRECRPTGFELADATALRNGIIVLTYRNATPL